MTNCAALRVARAEVQVREPALAPAAAPLHGQHHEVERVRRLELEPVEAALAGGVGRGQRLGHQALVSGVERLVEESLGLLGVAR